MNQETIIRMVREAESHWSWEENTKNGFLKLFAAIVAENTGIEQQREIVRLKGIIEEQANGAQNLVLEEREACAKMCDEQFKKYGCVADKCAAAIRARGEK